MKKDEILLELDKFKNELYNLANTPHIMGKPKLKQLNYKIERFFEENFRSTEKLDKAGYYELTLPSIEPPYADDTERQTRYAEVALNQSNLFSPIIEDIKKYGVPKKPSRLSSYFSNSNGKTTLNLRILKHEGKFSTSVVILIFFIFGILVGFILGFLVGVIY